MHIWLPESMCTIEKQRNIYISDDSYNDWYFHKIWSCFSGVHTFSHSNICLQNAWIILKFEIFVNKANFMPFWCYGNAMKFQNYYVFLSVSYTSLHIHKNNFHSLNLKFLSNFRSKTALYAPTPLIGNNTETLHLSYKYNTTIRTETPSNNTSK